MTAEQMEFASARLARKLGQEAEGDAALRMSDALEDAEAEVLLYLGADSLEDGWLAKVVDLAALSYRRDQQATQAGGLKSQSVTEGSLSQSVTYEGAEDTQRRAAAILASLARYRRVRCVPSDSGDPV